SEARFSKIHAFRFSARPGTPAASMPDQVDAVRKDERLHRLMALGDKLAAEYARRFIGRTLSVVAEMGEQGRWTGTSDNYLRVGFDGPDWIGGKLVAVRAEEARGPVIYGRLVSGGSPIA
ncbi:MAG: tRNA (N(6)-L-threonylcarbamoyladenosine(37)-C(2))-methylthiotransferase MtaB, partial [Chloroflexi bacterium]|nr:tRNA (N(6)-L-threonylcarbamoyladenosine(37)-C(2))-methylthiotransferase MtaB [Chloroflexota bacterium]